MLAGHRGFPAGEQSGGWRFERPEQGPATQASGTGASEVLLPLV